LSADRLLVSPEKMNMDAEPLIVERVFNAPVEKVWQAITDPAKMKEWYFDLKEFKAAVGFQFTFTGGDENKQWLHECTITEVIPGKKLQYSWRYPGYAGISYVTFELAAEENKTRLTLTHKGLESFPPDVLELAKENFMEGWEHIIGTSLKEFVERK
jgi:uncharacterized protein YndB with AHSA1/START domain